MQACAWLVLWLCHVQTVEASWLPLQVILHQEWAPACLLFVPQLASETLTHACCVMFVSEALITGMLPILHALRSLLLAGTLLVVQFFLFGWVEGKRWMDYRKPNSQAEPGSFLGLEGAFKQQSNGYPGGILFDPLGFSRSVMACSAVHAVL